MAKKQQPNSNIEEITAAEISTAIRYLDPRTSAKLNSEEILEAIRYLDPDLNEETAQQEDKTALVVCVSAFFLLFYLSVFVWIHHLMR